MTHDPFDGDTFVAASICGLSCSYEIVRPLMSTRHDGWSIRVSHRYSVPRTIGTGMTWVGAIRHVAELVENECAPEEGRLPEQI